MSTFIAYKSKMDRVRWNAKKENKTIGEYLNSKIQLMCDNINQAELGIFNTLPDIEYNSETGFENSMTRYSLKEITTQFTRLKMALNNLGVHKSSHTIMDWILDQLVGTEEDDSSFSIRPLANIIGRVNDYFSNPRTVIEIMKAVVKNNPDIRVTRVITALDDLDMAEKTIWVSYDLGYIDFIIHISADTSLSKDYPDEYKPIYDISLELVTARPSNSKSAEYYRSEYEIHNSRPIKNAIRVFSYFPDYDIAEKFYNSEVPKREE